MLIKPKYVNAQFPCSLHRWVNCFCSTVFASLGVCPHTAEHILLWKVALWESLQDCSLGQTLLFTQRAGTAHSTWQPPGRSSRCPPCEGTIPHPQSHLKCWHQPRIFQLQQLNGKIRGTQRAKASRYSGKGSAPSASRGCLRGARASTRSPASGEQCRLWAVFTVSYSQQGNSDKWLPGQLHRYNPLTSHTSLRRQQLRRFLQDRL